MTPKVSWWSGHWSFCWLLFTSWAPACRMFAPAFSAVQISSTTPLLSLFEDREARRRINTLDWIFVEKRFLVDERVSELLPFVFLIPPLVARVVWRDLLCICIACMYGSMGGILSTHLNPSS
ncbi:uncharacterized protein IWZ02DRAFT_102240 [Phyllosticta citriasiana]|uniref:uncharacterized protein n=1 Tax=Phyllosticta citriasiana TaxID=595635 RepID=UPI0030FD9675